MMTILEKNLKAIASYNKDLANAIKDNKGDFKLLFGADILDSNIITPQGKMYESPLKEISKQLENFESVHYLYTALFIFGLGNGIFIKSLLANNSHKNIIVFEPELGIAKIVLEVLDFSNEINNKRLIIANQNFLKTTDYQKIVYIESVRNNIKLYNLYINLPFYNFHEQAIKEINFNICEHYKQLMRELGNDSTDALIGINNTTQNIPFMLDGIPLKNIIKERKNKVKTAIIVSTGPSLTKQLPLLREIKDNAVIVCVDGSYPILKRENIEPDYVTSIERTAATSKIFESKVSEFDKNIIFVAASLTHPRTTEYFCNRNYSLYLRFLNYEKGFDDNEFGYIGSGGSAAHVALMLAMLLKSQKIIFIGQDLAFGENDDSHAQGHIYSTNHIKPSDKDELITLDPDKEESPQVSWKVEFAPAYGGNGEVRTSMIWNTFRLQFENVIAESKNIEFYNCTEGGARIAGTIEKPFKEMVEIILKENKPKMPLPKCIDENQKAKKYKKYSNHLNEVLEYGQKLQKEAQNLFLEIKEQTSQKIDFEKLQKLCDKIDIFKTEIRSEKFLNSYHCIAMSYLQHAEINFAPLLAVICKNKQEEEQKLFEWISLQAPWLFTIAGMISVMNENIIKSSKKWLIKEF